tara:strand:- start:5771 stop:7705 length:1935 start_codon:yes stop_codon:yes gene_type:complete
MKSIKTRTLAVAIHDIVMAAASFEIAVWVRYWTFGAVQPIGFLWEGTLLFAAVSAVAFWWLGLYRGIWHYASLNDLLAIVKGVTAAVLVFLLIMFTITRLADYPRSSVFINWPLLVLLLGVPRFFWRLLKDRSLVNVFVKEDTPRVPVLLIGTGDTAESFVREMVRSRFGAYSIVGIIDDGTGRVGTSIHGIRVLGNLSVIKPVITQLAKKGRKPHRLVLASDTLDGLAVRNLLDITADAGMSLARLPRMTELERDFHGGVSTIPEPQPIDVADLLGRTQTVMDIDATSALIRNQKVLVTGAGGTIGSELSRQIAEFKPAQLILLDNGEHNLYRIDQELSEQYAKVPRKALLGNICDSVRVHSIFSEERPALVFHAAAFKHVPLGESNPNETVLTNALGTRVISDACQKFDVKVMVLISTDKAVNPTSVMGASKRVAEILCQTMGSSLNAHRRLTNFVTVRFGNVLDSTGSVVPLFRRQLSAGGPLTVTHRDVKRYFMTTKEAVALVLQASALPQTNNDINGHLFVLDMGEPIRIHDLARQMIRLAGRTPEQDVKVIFTGLRPGEKLDEELLHKAEKIIETTTPNIVRAAPRTVNHEGLMLEFDQLIKAAKQRNTPKTLATLQRIVPEYIISCKTISKTEDNNK